jgi:hypothetical protein
MLTRAEFRALRRVIALWLCPDLADLGLKYTHLKKLVDEADTHLGNEHWQVRSTCEWIWATHHNKFRRKHERQNYRGIPIDDLKIVLRRRDG